MTLSSSKYPDQFPDARKSIPYDTLAHIYDYVMRHVDYPQWARYLVRILEKYDLNSTRILDIGCGTGKLCQELTQMGYEVDGCDPSPTMLNIARRNNKQGRFWPDQLPELQNTPSGTYPVMTCLYDTMNYLTSVDIITEALRRIYDLLIPGGIFIFDVVSENFCQLYFHNTSEEEIVNEDYAYSRKSYYNKNTAEQFNEFIIHTPGGVLEEIHIQKIYSFSLLKNIISQKSKFNLPVVYEDFTFYEADSSSGRAHFILKKKKP